MSADLRRALAIFLLLASAAAGDVVHLKDGSHESGTLTFCDEEVCAFGKRRIERAQIARIVFRDDVALPTGVRGVVFTTGSVRGGAFTGLTLGYVGLNGEELDREEVAAILLEPLPKPPSEEPPGGFARPVDPASPADAPAPPAAPPVQAPPPPPVPAPRPAPPTSPDQPAPRVPGTRGGLWTGTMQGRGWGTTSGIFNDLCITIDVRLREYIHPLVIVSNGKIKKIGTTTQLEPEATVVRNVFRCTADSLTCSGEGTTTVSIAPDQQNAGHPSWIIHKTSTDSMQPFHGYDIPQGSELYLVAIDALRMTYPVTYRGSVETTIVDTTFAAWMAGTHPLIAQRDFDRELRFLEGGKMIGSYTVPGSGAYPQISLSWAICREGVACPQAPPLPEGNDEPLPPRDQAENRDPCTELQQLIQAMRTLRETYELHEAGLHDAAARRDAAREAIWGVDGALRKYFTSMLSLAGSGASAALKKAIGIAKTLMDANGSAKDLYGAAKALGYGPQDVLRDAAAKEAVRAAVARADEYLKQTGDHQGALRVYAGSIERFEKLAGTAKKITAGVGTVTGALDYATKTSALADLIQNYLEANDDAARSQNEMDDAQERMRDLQLRIDEARRGCPSASRRMREPLAELASHRVLALAGAPAAAGSEPLHERLRALGQKLRQLPAHYEGAAPWLLPFLFEAADGASAELISALAGEALPHLDPADETLDEVLAEEERIEQELERAVPRAKAGPKT